MLAQLTAQTRVIPEINQESLDSVNRFANVATTLGFRKYKLKTSDFQCPIILSSQASKPRSPAVVAAPALYECPLHFAGLYPARDKHNRVIETK
jgi:hypothetical protein